MKNAKTQSFVPFGKRLATGLLRKKSYIGCEIFLR